MPGDAPPSPRDAIVYDDVSFTFPAPALAAPTPALSRVSLAVHEGERLGILGPNGGGKTTLVKLTLGLLRGQSGRISVLGMSPDAARAARVIGYVPQRSEAELAFPLSVRDAVAMGVAAPVPPWKPLPRDARAAIDDAIALVGAAPFADRPVGQISGGQLQRAMIARALAVRPRILLLDEPTVGIDPSGQQQFAELLARLNRELRLTIVVVSHDLRAVAAGCDRVACLSRTLHFHDSPRGLTPAVLAEVFRHDVAAVFGDVHIDAHRASQCTDPSHAHGAPTPASGSVVPLDVSAPAHTPARAPR
jgi:zinc transport system ATP-binding protein